MSATGAGRSGPTVVVSGDITIDWHLARRAPRGTEGTWHPDLRARLGRQRGGAALLADLVKAALEDWKEILWWTVSSHCRKRPFPP